jgi:hypothetical protein
VLTAGRQGNIICAKHITEKAISREEDCWVGTGSFNYITLKDNATYANPRRHPDGIKAVILNGQGVVKDGQRLDGRVGRVLSKRDE